MASPDRYHHWLEVARSIQQEADAAGVGQLHREVTSNARSPRTVLERFDEAVTDGSLRSASRKLFSDGHYARAVEEAFKCLNNTVKSKSGLSKLDGDTLMREAFSVNNPKLRLNRMRTTTDQNEQRGYMELFAGAMTAIRNPRAHEHALQDDPPVALELLTVANHLMGKVETSRKARAKKKKP